MIENMQPKRSCSQKRTVCVHRDQMCIWFECLALCLSSCIALPDCFSTHCIIALNQTGEWDYNKGHTALWIQQAALRTFVLLSFSLGNKMESNEGKYTCFHFRLFSYTHNILYTVSPVHNSKVISALNCFMWGTRPACARGHCCVSLSLLQGWSAFVLELSSIQK